MSVTITIPEAPFSDDDWLTPPELLKQFGAFDLDPFMSVVQPWRTAARHYTMNENGLVKPWEGRVWVNPPYSEMEACMAKLAAHIKAGGTGMSLVNARTETKWFFSGVWELADAVFFPKARLKFVRPDGQIGQTGKMGSVIAAYSEHDSKLLYGVQKEGKFICLRFRLGQEIKSTWRRIVRFAMKQAGGVVTLEQLYELVSDHPKASQNPNWKAKVRQIVQKEGSRVGPSLWELAEAQIQA